MAEAEVGRHGVVCLFLLEKVPARVEKRFTEFFWPLESPKLVYVLYFWPI